MADEYTPTMAEVRKVILRDSRTMGGADFDVALAAHDAEIRRDQAEKDIRIIEELAGANAVQNRIITAVRAQFTTPSPETEQEPT